MESISPGSKSPDCIKVLVILGIGRDAYDSRLPLPVGATFISLAFCLSCKYPFRIPSSIKMLRADFVPSSSIVIEPRLSDIVPSSITVTPLAATCSPTLPEKIEVPLRLKSPSRPCPTASCNITPGHPGPRTISISPAGAGMDSRPSRARRNASSTSCCQLLAFRYLSNIKRPPEPLEPVSILPFASTITDTFNLTNGLISAARYPSGLNICTACHEPAIDAETCFTLLSLSRAYLSIDCNSFTFASKGVTSSGFASEYSGKLAALDGDNANSPEYPLVTALTVWPALSKAAVDISPEWANASASPIIALNPKPQDWL